MKIANNCVVTVNYRLLDEEGGVLDSSDQDGPLVYLHGVGQMIEGLENALDGHAVGEALDVRVPPEEAYGDYDPSLVEKVPRTNFPGVEAIEPGMRFESAMEDDEPMVVTVVEVDDKWVHVDGNHPMAGRTMHFQLEVIEVRAATMDEMEHGHAHAHGSCAH